VSGRKIQGMAGRGWGLGDRCKKWKTLFALWGSRGVPDRGEELNKEKRD
jgi:hypothetical protein